MTMDQDSVDTADDLPCAEAIAYLDTLVKNFSITVPDEPSAQPDWARYVATACVCKAVMGDVLAAAGHESGVVGMTRRQLAFCVMIDVILARYIARRAELPTFELAAMKSAAELARDHDVINNLDALSRVVEYGIAWLGYMENGGQGESGEMFVESFERLLSAYALDPERGMPDKLVSGVQSLLDSVGREPEPPELADDYTPPAPSPADGGPDDGGGCCGGGCGCD